MSRMKVFFALALATLLGSIAATQVSAQVYVYGAPVFGPRIIAPVPYPVVQGYRVPAYVAPVAPVVTYNAYRPVVVAPPVYNPAGVVVTSRYRPAVVGPGIGGFPNVYRPGQPVRNALRFAIP